MRGFARTGDVTHGQIDSGADAMRDWAFRFGVSTDRLSAAVRAVGADVEAVRAYLFAESGELASWEDAWDDVTPLETRGGWDIFIR